MAKKKKVEKDNAERWLLTYSDLMNLLLIFFIILYTISQVDQKKFDQLSESLRDAFGTGSPATVISTGGSGDSVINMPNNLKNTNSKSPSPVIPSSTEDQKMQEIKGTIVDMAKQSGLEGEIEVSIKERGVEISIQEKVLFNPGNSILEQDARNTLQKLSLEVLKKIQGKYMRVEGHTDSDPINTPQFPTNWELSAARATNVLRFLVEKTGIDPTKITAVGCGEYYPKVKNDTPEHKAQNRRVLIVILKDMYNKAESGVSKTIDDAGNSTDTSTGSTGQPKESQTTDQAKNEKPASN